MPNGATPTVRDEADKSDRYAIFIPIGQLKDFLTKPILTPSSLPTKPRLWSLDKTADRITLALGSTESLVVHTFVFIVSLAFVYLGYALDSILLVVTTVVSLEAIYLAIFIQRTANKQSERMERLMREIRSNTVIHLDRPLDQVVGEIHKDLRHLHSKIEAGAPVPTKPA